MSDSRNEWTFALLLKEKEKNEKRIEYVQIVRVSPDIVPDDFPEPQLLDEWNFRSSWDLALHSSSEYLVNPPCKARRIFKTIDRVVREGTYTAKSVTIGSSVETYMEGE